MAHSRDKTGRETGPAPDPAVAGQIAAARAGDRQAFDRIADPFRRELQVHCYRMLGSLQDAEDLVQETLLRAWSRLNTYEGRAPFRAWLYKIATNLCLDALAARHRRVLPQSKYPAADPRAPLAPPAVEPDWLEPFPDEWLADEDKGPEARYTQREAVTLAFLTALQMLPPRQRATLILRDVLDWHADEVAQLLDMTVSSVNSALHRARSTLARHYPTLNRETMSAQAGSSHRTLLDRYVHAWQAADIDELISLLKEDATFPMPPSPSWYQGREAIRTFVAANILAGDARGRWKLVPMRANGQPAYAWYMQKPDRAGYAAFAIQVLTFDGDLLSDITTFPFPHLFPFFDLPREIP